MDLICLLVNNQCAFYTDRLILRYIGRSIGQSDTDIDINIMPWMPDGTLANVTPLSRYKHSTRPCVFFGLYAVVIASFKLNCFLHAIHIFLPSVMAVAKFKS